MIDPFGIRAAKEEKEKLDAASGSSKKPVGEESPYSLAGRSADDDTGDHEVNPVVNDIQVGR